MPLFLHDKNESYELAIWEIEETESFFLERAYFVNPENLSNYKHPKSRLQWIASRFLLHNLLGDKNYSKLLKNSSGTPVSDDGTFHLSISHSESMVAVALSEQNIGIDIQQYLPKLSKIATKFILQKDLDLIKKDKDALKIIHQHWGVKEAVFKAYGLGNLDYKENIFLEKVNLFFENEIFPVVLIKADIQTVYTARTFEIGENYLVSIVTI